MHRRGRAPPKEGVASVRGSFVCRVCGLGCNRLRLYGSLCQGDLGPARRQAKAAKAFAHKCFSKVSAAERFRQLAEWKAELKGGKGHPRQPLADARTPRESAKASTARTGRSAGAQRSVTDAASQAGAGRKSMCTTGRVAAASSC
eukprot:7606947-Alexandrium_andersonii.AAC.1